VENLGAGAEGLREAREVFRHDHELLEVDRRVAVGAAVEDVHHRHGEDLGIWPAEVFVEWLADLRCGCFRGGEGDGEDGIRADLFLGRGAVGGEHRLIHGELIGGIEPNDGRGEDFRDIRDGFGHALAEVAGFVSVAEFDGFVFTGAGAAGNGRAADGSACEFDIGFNGWVAARVEDLAGADGKNGCVGHKKRSRNQSAAALARTNRLCG